MEDEQKVPHEISCSDQIFDVAMHKSSNTLAAGLITGCLEVWRHTGNGDGDNTLLMNLQVNRDRASLCECPPVCLFS